MPNRRTLGNKRANLRVTSAMLKPPVVTAEVRVSILTQLEELEEAAALLGIALTPMAVYRYRVQIGAEGYGTTGI